MIPQCKLRLNRHRLRTMPKGRSERNWNFWKAYLVLSQGHTVRTWQKQDFNPGLFSSKVHALSTGGLSKGRGAKTERSCTIVIREISSRYQRRALSPAWEYAQGKPFWRIYLNWGLKDCSCLSKEERKKAIICVGRGDHEDQSFSFRWSLSPWEGGFPMLSPPSSAPCHCTMTSHRVSDTLTWGFPEAFSQLLGQWPAFCQLLCVWLLANHFPSLGWSYFIHKTVEGKWLWLYISVTMLETIELYTSNRWVIWYVNYISKSCCLFVCFHCSVLGAGGVLPKGWKAVAIKALLLTL